MTLPDKGSAGERLLCPRIGLDETADVEIAEFGVLRAGFVEPHLGDELLEVHRILREERDAPFPPIETDRAGDNLHNTAGIAAAGEAVAVQQLAPLRPRTRVPVLNRHTAFRSRVET